MDTSPSSIAAVFQAALQDIGHRHLPSRHPFFARLSSTPSSIVMRPEVLGELYVRYQAAMHATRAMVYHLPCLDAPALRKRKLQVFVDDDGLAGGDTHHDQLRRAFRRIGARPRLEDDAFGELAALCLECDPALARFIRTVEQLYPRSLGAWSVVERLSDDWMRALAAGLATHFPAMLDEPYFADCFAHGVEDRHAAEAATITEHVLQRHPERLDGTLRDAQAMVVALDDVWGSLERVLVDAAVAHGACLAAA